MQGLGRAIYFKNDGSRWTVPKPFDPILHVHGTDDGPPSCGLEGGAIVDLKAVLQSIADSGAEVTAAIRDEWDCGWQVRLDDAMEPLAADLKEAAQWLNEQMLQRYPLSKYKGRITELSNSEPASNPDLCEVLEALYKNEDRVGLRLVSSKGWDITFNHSIKRVASLGEAAQWLNHQRPGSEATTSKR